MANSVLKHLNPGLYIFLLLAFLISLAFFLRPNNAAHGAVTTVSGQISAGADDAHQKNNGSWFSSTAPLVRAGNLFSGGLRFTNITVPKDAVVDSASIDCYINNTTRDDPSLRIYADDVDNSVNFTTQRITPRAKTSASVLWNGTNLGTGYKTSPDISSVIQEVINRPGWNSGNAITFILMSNNSNLDFRCISFEGGSTARRAKLNLTYHLPEPSPTPTPTPAPLPTVDLKVNNQNGPVTIAHKAAATLSWTSTNATACTTSGDWTGTKPISGSESTGNLTTNKTYILTCTGPDGSASDSVTVNEVKMFITDTWNYRIVGMDDLTGADWAAFGSQGAGINQFNRPHGPVVGPDSKIYIADAFNHRIVRIDDLSGTGWVGFGSLGIGTNQFERPRDIAIDAANKIYIADGCNHRLVRIDNMTGAGWTAKPLPNPAPPGPCPNSGTGPAAVFVDGTGAIYLTDMTNSRILKYDNWADNTPEMFGSFGSGQNQFDRPHKIYVKPTGQIYVSDRQNFRIVRINDMTGDGWTTLGGTAGTGVGQFQEPNGIIFDSAGKMYIVDQISNGRVVVTGDMSTAGWTEYRPTTGSQVLDRPSAIFIVDAS